MLTWKEITVSHAELDFDVDAIGIVPFDERRPQPVVDIVVGDITYDIRPPVDALLKVGEALFDPLKKKKKTKLVWVYRGKHFELDKLN